MPVAPCRPIPRPIYDDSTTANTIATPKEFGYLPPLPKFNDLVSPVVVLIHDKIRQDLDDVENFEGFCWFAREYPRSHRRHFNGVKFRLKSIHSLMRSLRTAESNCSDFYKSFSYKWGRPHETANLSTVRSWTEVWRKSRGMQNPIVKEKPRMPEHIYRGGPETGEYTFTNVIDPYNILHITYDKFGHVISFEIE
jgi:hypothetical protein